MIEFILKLILVFFFLFFFDIAPASAFLPPEFFVQGSASIGTVLAGGIAVAFFPLLVFFRFIKRNFKKHKKLILFIVLQNVLIGGMAGMVFYNHFYKPLYESSYFFAQGYGNSQLAQDRSQVDLRELNPNYIVQDSHTGLLDDKYGNRSTVDPSYAIKLEEIEGKIKKGERVNFIDIREKEEYQAGHIENSKHCRGWDLTIDKIKEIFNLSQKQFSEELFALVCHDGGRGNVITRKLNKKNIKYLVGGIEYSGVDKSLLVKISGPVVPDYKIFGEKYQTKYQLLARDAIEIIKNDKNVTIIDDREKELYIRKHIKDSIYCKIGHMSTAEYNQALEKILKHRTNRIIVLADRYGDLFYANLLLLRLERDYGFDDQKFHIVFHQFEEFERSADVEFESSY